MRTSFNATLWGDTHNLPTADDRVVYLYLCHNRAVEISGLYRVDLTTVLRETAVDLETLFRSLTLLGGAGLVWQDEGLVFVPRIPADQHLWSRPAWQQIVQKVRTRYGHTVNRMGRPNAAVAAWSRWVERHAPKHTQYNTPLSTPHTVTSNNTLHGTTPATPSHHPTVHPTGVQHVGQSTVMPTPIDIETRRQGDTMATKLDSTTPPHIPSPPNTISNSSSFEEGGVGGVRPGSTEHAMDDNTIIRNRNADTEAPDGSYLPPSVTGGAFFGSLPTDGAPEQFEPPTEAQVRMVMAAYVRRRWDKYPHFAAVDVDDEAGKFMDHFTATRWRRTRGIAMTDWQQAAQRWLREWMTFNAPAWEAFNRGLPLSVRAVEVTEHGQTLPPTLAAVVDPVAVWEETKRRLGFADDGDGSEKASASVDAPTVAQQAHNEHDESMISD